VNVVFLTYAYPPARYPRSIQIGRLAQYSRHALQIVCCEDGSPIDGTIPEAGPDRPVTVHRIPDRAPSWLRLLRRLRPPDPHLPWATNAGRWLAAAGLLKAADVLVSFGQPMSDHLAALALKRRFGLPWVAHFSDPWSDNPYIRGGRWWRSALLRMEAGVVAAADRLVFTSEETLDLVMAKYPAPWRDRARVLPHAYDPVLYPASSSSAGDGQGLVLRYLGNFYQQRNPRVLFDGLRRIRDARPDLLDGMRIELIGPQITPQRWETEAAGLPLHCRGAVSYLDSLRLMRGADALLVIDADFDRNVFFPSKLVDYLGARRPLLAITMPGTTADIVSAAGGFVAMANDPESVAAGLRQLLDALVCGTAAVPDPQAVAYYAAPRVAAEFDALLEELVVHR